MMEGETRGVEWGNPEGENVKFLIIRFSSIGDIVLTTPVIRCLKKQVPGASIHYLTKPQFLPVVTSNPYIDHIHVLQDLPGTIRTLREERYDYIIDLHNNLRSSIIKSRLPGVPFTLNKINIEKWLLVNLRIDYLPDVHIVDRNLETLRIFDVVNDNKGLDYFIPEEDEIDITSLPEIFRDGYVLFAIGANHATKRLPVDKITEVCRHIKRPVILAGGGEDAGRGEEISGACGELVWNSCGKYNLGNSASLVRQARVVISHDTGLMHIAAAFRKKIISIWGNTVPRFGMYPYLPHPRSAAYEVGGLKCRPCSKIGYKKCPLKHFRCMTEQDTAGIASYARELFGNHNA
jgi:ADP-heptose:LPS heptosyltransferase